MINIVLHIKEATIFMYRRLIREFKTVDCYTNKSSFYNEIEQDEAVKIISFICIYKFMLAEI